MTVLTINVTNNSDDTQSFFLFQQAATLLSGTPVFSASLDCEMLGPHGQTGATLTFELEDQIYACIQQARQAPRAGLLTGHSSASRAIDLAGPSGAANATTASFNPLGLSAPENDPGAQPRSFRVTVPSYNPRTETYNVGSGVHLDGRVILSSFAMALPNFIVDCHPTPIFFVQRGNVPSGTTIDALAASSDAARCDFSDGHSVMNVALGRDGTWSVQAVR